METRKPETENRQTGEKLDKEQIENVTGGDSPFADIPRVPVQPIDDKLRKNG